MERMARLPKANFQEIDRVKVLTDRVKKRREAYMTAIPRVCSERCRLATESWKETEDQPLEIRRAKLFEKVLEGIPIVIRDGELIVGSQTKYVRGANSPIDLDAEIATQDLVSRAEAMKANVSIEDRKMLLDSASCVAQGQTMYTEVIKADLPDADREIIREAARFWKGRTPICKQREVFKAVFGTWLDDAEEARITSKHDKGPLGRDLDYGKGISKGLLAVIEEAKDELHGLNHFDLEELHKFYFLQAVIIALEAVIKFAGRHAQLARELVVKEKDPVRKGELERIAEICEWVPKNPARSFQEAVQSFWFLLLALNLETGAFAEGIGRFDQYMYPFYKKDIEGGVLTRQEAAEILGCLWIKFTEMECRKSAETKEKATGNQLLNLTIGGVTKEGEDATNELSYLVLEVASQVRTHQPSVSLRYHDGLSEDFLIKAVKTNIATGGSMPEFFNDKVVIRQMVEMGVSIEDARDWGAQTNSFVGIPHRGSQYGRHVTLHLAKILEITLNNGVDPRTGRKILPETGDPRSFSSFEELYEAYRKQFNYVLKQVAKASRIAGALAAENYASPFHSALVDDCIKKGRDAAQGGQRYLQLMLGSIDRGHVNTANSLAAIKKLVFEEKKITMAELLGALAVNFEGKEKVHQMLLAAPKWGNDDDEADDIMKDLWAWTAKAIRSEVNVWGKPVAVGRNGALLHHYYGKTLGALPDGRKAYLPLAEGSVSPMVGTDTKGPTAVINSASKLDFTGHTCAVLTLKLSQASVRSSEGMRKALALIKSYFDRHGFHIQFNILNKETLLDARKHPEQYRDLLTRVAGLGAYFIELPTPIQEEIIARTE